MVPAAPVVAARANREAGYEETNTVVTGWQVPSFSLSLACLPIQNLTPTPSLPYPTLPNPTQPNPTQPSLHSEER